MAENRIDGYIPMPLDTNLEGSAGRLNCTRVTQVIAASYSCSGITTP